MNEWTESGPQPTATICWGSAMRTVATTRLLTGSIRVTVPSASLGTHTAPAATTGGPTERPTWNSAWTGRRVTAEELPPQAAPTRIKSVNPVTSFFTDASYRYHSGKRPSTGLSGRGVPRPRSGGAKIGRR